MDSIDHHIVNELRQNSRISLTELAAKVGRSRTAVISRVNKLERDGKILGYTIKELHEESDLTFGALIFVALKVRKNFETFISDIKKIPHVTSCTWIIGDHDFVVTVAPAGKEELKRVVERIFQIDGVKNTQTHLALHREF